MTYEIYATISDEYGTLTVPTGVWGYSRADLLFEVAGLTRRNPGTSFHIEEVLYGDEFNAY